MCALYLTTPFILLVGILALTDALNEVNRRKKLGGILREAGVADINMDPSLLKVGTSSTGEVSGVSWIELGTGGCMGYDNNVLTYYRRFVLTIGVSGFDGTKESCQDKCAEYADCRGVNYVPSPNFHCHLNVDPAVVLANAGWNIHDGSAAGEVQQGGGWASDWECYIRQPETASVIDDPHFVGFDHSHYDFQGVPGEVFNLITDHRYQCNALFIESSDSQTYIGELGFLLEGAKVRITTKEVTVDGETISEGPHAIEPSGLVFVENGTTKVITHGFTVVATLTHGESEAVYLNLDSTAHATAVHAPHGILGQTAQFLVTGETPKPVTVSHKNKNSKGFIEGLPTDYVVHDGLFGTKFTFNRYGDQATAQPAMRNFTSAAWSFAHAKAIGLRE